MKHHKSAARSSMCIQGEVTDDVTETALIKEPQTPVNSDNLEELDTLQTVLQDD